MYSIHACFVGEGLSYFQMGYMLMYLFCLFVMFWLDSQSIVGSRDTL